MPSLDELQYKEVEPELFPNFGKETENLGPSPYAYTSTEGPSYIAPQDRPKPLQPSGIFKNEYGKHGRDISPLLGVEYSDDVQVADFVNTLLDESATEEARAKAREILRDIAIEASRKGVIVFRHQHKLTVQNQKDLTDQLGLLAGRPKQNGLHIHPRAPRGGIIGEDGLIDPHVYLVTSTTKPQTYGINRNAGAYGSSAWHTDLAYEPVIASYSALKIFQRPADGSGGDTVFANGYALYERLSKPFQNFLKGLTGIHNLLTLPGENYGSYTGARGAPENSGSEYEAAHPIIRTNPVTGWNSLFAAGYHFDRFKELNPIESQNIVNFLHDTLVHSHDLQIRLSWESDSDLVVWDNRSSFHTATSDFKGSRRGVRTTTVGERPYFDENGGLQSEAIYKEIEESIGPLNA